MIKKQKSKPSLEIIHHSALKPKLNITPWLAGIC
jgi:hypothetical protein